MENLQHRWRLFGVIVAGVIAAVTWFTVVSPTKYYADVREPTSSSASISFQSSLSSSVECKDISVDTDPEDPPKGEEPPYECNATQATAIKRLRERYKDYCKARILKPHEIPESCPPGCSDGGYKTSPPSNFDDKVRCTKGVYPCSVNQWKCVYEGPLVCTVTRTCTGI
jgi:hypothetical protein